MINSAQHTFGIAATVTGGAWVATLSGNGLENFFSQNSLGGYGLLISGIVVLWKELKAERKRSDDRHHKHIEFTDECTKAIRELSEKKCTVKCKVLKDNDNEGGAE